MSVYICNGERGYAPHIAITYGSHPCPLCVCHAEIDRLVTTLRDIADRWSDDTVHSQRHRPDCEAVVCVAKRALDSAEARGVR